MEQGTEEWKEWRRKGIGASDIAAIIGVCKYSTPYKVWLEKTGKSKGFEGNFATERGSELEPKVRARYEFLSMEDMPPGLAVHPKYEMFRASLDGRRVDGRKILEMKVPSRESHLEALSGKVPAHYIPQTQFQLGVTGADVLDYFSFNDREPDLEISAIVEVIPDIEYQGMLFAKGLEFWELVTSNTPPPLTDRDDKLIESGPAFEICHRLVKEKETLKKSVADRLKAEAIEAGGHSRIRCGKILLTKSLNKAGAFTYRMTVGKESAT